MPPFAPEHEAVIVATCNEHEATHGPGNKITTCVLGRSTYTIKFGISQTLASRIVTQPFLYDAKQESDKLRIPKLIHHFDNGQGKTYLVMESIKLVESLPSDLDKRIEDALTWLSGVSAPSNHKLGPLGGGCIRHDFFESGEAPLAFVDVKAVELYMEKGRRRLVNEGKGLNPVTLEGERLMWVQASMDDSHFGVDEKGNTVMMGFGSISFLPESFARYTLTQFGNDRFAALPETLGWSGASNMDAMVEIATNLGMTGDPSLGLNEYGKPKTANKGRKN